MPADPSAPLLVLPDEHRQLFKEPLGPVVTDPGPVAADCAGPLITVGDIVTYEFETAGYSPSVAIIDETTAREPISTDVREVLASRSHRLSTTNPPGTITAALIKTIKRAYNQPPPVTVVVDGEEDLATLPAVLHAPPTATVVYGQPDAGMVVLTVSDRLKSRCRELLTRFEGDHDRAMQLFTEEPV